MTVIVSSARSTRSLTARDSGTRRVESAEAAISVPADFAGCQRGGRKSGRYQARHNAVRSRSGAPPPAGQRPAPNAGSGAAFATSVVGRPSADDEPIRRSGAAHLVLRRLPPGAAQVPRGSHPIIASGHAGRHGEPDLEGRRVTGEPAQGERPITFIRARRRMVPPSACSWRFSLKSQKLLSLTRSVIP